MYESRARAREREGEKGCLSLFFGTHSTRSTSTWSQLKIVLHVNRFNIQVQTTHIRAHKDPSQSFPMKVSFTTTMNYENYVHPRDDDFNWIYLHKPKMPVLLRRLGRARVHQNSNEKCKGRYVFWKHRRNATCLNIINWTYDSIIINAYMPHIIQFTYLHTYALWHHS